MRLIGFACAAAFTVAACSAGGKGDQQAAATSEPTTGVTRQEATPPPPPPSAVPTTTPIQTQPGPEGRYVDLLRANVVGDVLSVTVTYRAGPGTRPNGKRWHNTFDFKLDEVSAIDDATSQSLGVLKDDQGKWMASPLSSDAGKIEITASDEDVQAWFKFPAPSPGTKTVSINIPGAGSFDAVPVAR